MRKVDVFITTEKQIHYLALDTIVIQATLYRCKNMYEGEKYRLSCGAGAGTTKTLYSERCTIVTILEEKLQVKK
jgi:hypothetical protein